MEPNVKKYFLTIVTAVLVLISLIITAFSKTEVVTAGAGNGINFEVSTPVDMYDVLDYLSAKNSFTRSISTADELLEQEHTSATLRESTYIEETTLNTYALSKRELTIYLTEDAYYAISNGFMQAEKTQSNKATASHYSIFDMQLYIEGNMALMKMNKFSIEETEGKKTGGLKMKEEYLGKWIELPREYALDFISTITDNTADALSSIKECIKRSIEDDDTIIQGDVYTLKEKKGDINITVTTDLSSKEYPCASYFLNSETKSKISKITDILYCQNIDNTVIKVKHEADVVCKTARDFEKIFYEY